MSLARRVELETLKAANTKLSNEVSAVNNKIIKAATESLRKDFRAFFETIGFKVEVNQSAFASGGQGNINASHGTMKATLSQAHNSDNHLTIDSNINNGTSQYHVGVYVTYPDSIKSTTPPNPFREFKNEDEETEQKIKEAREESERLEELVKVKDEIKHSFSVTWDNSKTNKRRNATSDSFDAILKEIFK